MGIDIERLSELEAGIPRMRLSEALEIAAFVQNEIQRIVAAYARQTVDL